MLNTIKRHSFKLLCLFFILMIAAGSVFTVSLVKTHARVDGYLEGDEINDAAKDYSESHKDDDDSGSLDFAHVAVAAAQFFNYRVVKSMDENKSSYSEMFQGTNNTYIGSPGDAGSYLAYSPENDENKYNFLISAFTKASASYSYNMTYSFGETQSDFYGYTAYGSLLSSLGLDKYGKEGSTEFGRIIGGSMLVLWYMAASSVPRVFAWIIDVLNTLNPFGLLINTDMKGTGTVSLTNSAVSSSATASSGTFAALRDWYTRLINWMTKFSWQIMIPLCIALLIAGFLLFKNMGSTKNRAKKLLIRIVFLAIGIPLLGTMYTTVLTDMKTVVEAPATAPDVAVASTVVDFGAWVSSSNLLPPYSGTGNVLAGQIVDRDTHKIEPTTESYWALKNHCLSLNREYADYIGNITLLADDSNDIESSMTEWSTAVLERGSDSSSIVNTGIMKMLANYLTGDVVTSGSYASTIAASHSSSSDKAIVIMFRNMNTFTKWKDNWKDDGNPNEQQINQLCTDSQWGSFMTNGALSVSASGSHQAGIKWYDETWSFTNGQQGWGAERYIKGRGNVTLGLSDMAMYNYLNTQFKSTEAVVYSPLDTVSVLSQIYHKSVNSIGTGFLGFLFVFHTLVTLAVYAIIGWCYAIGLLFQNLKRMVTLLIKIPAAALGVMRSMAQVVAYIVAMIVEVIATILLYSIVMRMMDAITSVIMQGASSLFASDNSTSPATLMLMLVVVSIALIVFGVAAIKARKTIIKAIDEGLNGLIGRVFGTDNLMPTPEPKNHPIANGLMTGAAMAAGNRLMGGLGGGAGFTDTAGGGDSADGSERDDGGYDTPDNGGNMEALPDDDSDAVSEDAEGRDIAENASLADGARAALPGGSHSSDSDSHDNVNSINNIDARGAADSDSTDSGTNHDNSTAGYDNSIVGHDSSTAGHSSTAGYDNSTAGARARAAYDNAISNGASPKEALNAAYTAAGGSRGGEAAIRAARSAEASHGSRVSAYNNAVAQVDKEAATAYNDVIAHGGSAESAQAMADSVRSNGLRQAKAVDSSRSVYDRVRANGGTHEQAQRAANASYANATGAYMTPAQARTAGLTGDARMENAVRGVNASGDIAYQRKLKSGGTVKAAERARASAMKDAASAYGVTTKAVNEYSSNQQRVVKVQTNAKAAADTVYYQAVGQGQSQQQARAAAKTVYAQQMRSGGVTPQQVKQYNDARNSVSNAVVTQREVVNVNRDVEIRTNTNVRQVGGGQIGGGSGNAGHIVSGSGSGFSQPLQSMPSAPSAAPSAPRSAPLPSAPPQRSVRNLNSLSGGAGRNVRTEGPGWSESGFDD